MSDHNSDSSFFGFVRHILSPVKRTIIRTSEKYANVSEQPSEQYVNVFEQQQKNNEMVLCVENERLESIAFLPKNSPGSWFIPERRISLEYFAKNCLYDEEHGKHTYLPRSVAETSDKYKHLVTYTQVIDQSGDIYCYRRGKSGGESRLHDLWSIGIGGHITNSDFLGPNGLCSELPVDDLIEIAALRELTEETSIRNNKYISLKYIGLIIDNSNAVGKVHAGLAFQCRIISDIQASEGCLEDFSKMPRREVEQKNLESWSRILMLNT